MKLASSDGQTFEMRILGYQFPHLETELHDSNWLIIAGEVTHPKGSWQFKAPCLLTYEAERLASWIDLVAEGEQLPTSCSFLDANRRSNDNMLSLSCEFLRPAPIRWFQRFG
jgi:hypothetical protein